VEGGLLVAESLAMVKENNNNNKDNNNKHNKRTIHLPSETTQEK
jgi:hypothetical protein